MPGWTWFWKFCHLSVMTPLRRLLHLSGISLTYMMPCPLTTFHQLIIYCYNLNHNWNRNMYLYMGALSNQSTLSTSKRLASLIVLIFDCLDNWYFKLIILSIAICNCMYMELGEQCTYMYDPYKCWFYFSKTQFFGFLLIQNCENLAKKLLPLE